MIRDDRVTTREPIRLGLRTYNGPITEAAVMAWLDEVLTDQRRIGVTNLTLAAREGEIDDLDGALAFLLEESDRTDAEARERFRAFLKEHGR